MDYLTNDGKALPRLVLLGTSSYRKSTGSKCSGASAKTTAHA